MTAREEILLRIGRAKVEPTLAIRATPSDSSRPREEIVRQFVEYAAEYKARVTTTNLLGLPGAIEGFVGSLQEILIPKDLPLPWIPSSFKAVPDPEGPPRDLDGYELVLTACAYGIAETGTIVLDSGFAQGRRALTLVPDHHICVLFEEQILDSVPEAIARLADAISNGQPLTFISGPSATSDIELSRVEGVHGPRNLDIVVVRGS